MHLDILLFGMLVVSFIMVVAKRVTALINEFSVQSFILFLITLFHAIASKSIELYFVAGLLFLIKVILIPLFLHNTSKKIKIDEKLGLLANPTVSLLSVLFLTYLCYLFVSTVIPAKERIYGISFVSALSVTTIGIFIMVFRMKAVAQIIGLLVIENGLFLLGATISGGMPFFVEIAIFFDIFVCVIILGIFIYRINKLFTHIDISKLTRLKG